MCPVARDTAYALYDEVPGNQLAGVIDVKTTCRATHSCHGAHKIIFLLILNSQRLCYFFSTTC